MVNKIDNPYLDEYTKLPRSEFFPYGATGIDFTAGRDIRKEMSVRYAWAVPTQELIERIVRESPIIEIGAGAGYWAHLIEQAGGNIIAFDERPVPDPENIWCSQAERSWFKVERGGPEQAGDHPDRTLFLCWPPYATPMAYDCLSAYKGDILIFVGEGSEGCTGDGVFWEELDTNWNKVDSLSIPQWSGLHDDMKVYKRGHGD